MSNNPQAQQSTPASQTHAPDQSQQQAVGVAGMSQACSVIDSGNSAQCVRESSEEGDQQQESSEGFFQQTAGQVRNMAQGAGTVVKNVAQGAGETVKNVAHGTGQTVVNIAHSATETVKNSLAPADKNN